MAGRRDVVRMVVLDPDERLRRLLTQLFTDTGYQVVASADLDDAVVQAADAGVVLADWDAAGTDGLTRLAAQAPTVVLATDPHAGDAARRAGAAGFAIKGDDLSLLTQQVLAAVPPAGR